MTTDILIPYIATFCFAIAVIHTFSVKLFQEFGTRYPEGSVGENLFHLLGEIEVVFGIWAGVFILAMMSIAGKAEAISYLENRNFTEPLFVFVIMVVCASRPILEMSEGLIKAIGKLLPMNKGLGFYFSSLVFGPLLGSFITEPAAMTVTALILLKYFYQHKMSDALKYATIGLLFVNISIGGTLTPFAAPPVLMVAPKWNWDLQFMFMNFGWKAIVAILISTSLICIRFKNELSKFKIEETKDKSVPIPAWVNLLHLFLLFVVVLFAHHIELFMGIFLFFLGIASVTKEYQSELKIKESLLVGFFLGGLIVLGGYQSWWLEPILTKLSALPMYLGSMGLTAFTDNAAITYLGSQVPNLSDLSKYALVAGSVVGGGMTVIANAPNPAGYSTLNPFFGTNGISPLLLARSALIPTLISAICFWLL